MADVKPSGPPPPPPPPPVSVGGGDDKPLQNPGTVEELHKKTKGFTMFFCLCHFWDVNSPSLFIS